MCMKVREKVYAGRCINKIFVARLFNRGPNGRLPFKAKWSLPSENKSIIIIIIIIIILHVSGKFSSSWS